MSCQLKSPSVLISRSRSTPDWCFTFCLTVTQAVFLGSFLSRAKAKEPKTAYYKYYTSVEIQPGDTLWTLADCYLENYESKELYINEVIELNSLAGNGRIISGQNLILPYYSQEYKP